MRKMFQSTILALLAVVLLVFPVSAGRAVFPDVIQLPVGFQPEGIALGSGYFFYTGSLADGSILRGNLRSGETSVLVEGQEGMVSVGMSYDRRSRALFVAGGPTGMARVFDTATGKLIQSYPLIAPQAGFINDVIVTAKAAYFTSSAEPMLYKVPLGPRGRIPQPDAVVPIPLSGEWQQQASGFNANGIEATPNGKWLIVVNTSLGELYRVNPATGEAVKIDLGGEGLVSYGDGLLFRGSRLYVVRNQLNEIVSIQLFDNYTKGRVVKTYTNENLDVPTTITAFGNALYAVNAKFGNPAPAEVPYEVVRVPLTDGWQPER